MLITYASGLTGEPTVKSTKRKPEEMVPLRVFALVTRHVFLYPFNMSYILYYNHFKMSIAFELNYSPIGGKSGSVEGGSGSVTCVCGI